MVPGRTAHYAHFPLLGSNPAQSIGGTTDLEGPDRLQSFEL
jgi:hypothetical protein